MKYRRIWDIKHLIYQNYVQMDKETSVNVSAEGTRWRSWDKQAKNIERDKILQRKQLKRRAFCFICIYSP